MTGASTCADRGRLPPRPYLPAVVAAVAVACAIDALLMERAWSAFQASKTPDIRPAFVALVALGAAALTLVRRSRPRALRAVAVGLSLCAVVCLSCNAAAQHRLESFERIMSEPVSLYEIVITGDPSLGGHGFRSVAEVYDSKGEHVSSVEVSSADEIATGTTVRCVGRAFELEDDEWGKARYMEGLVAEIRIVAVLESYEGDLGSIDRFRSASLEAIDPGSSDSRALIAGLVCGRASELNAGRYADLFAATGTSHLVAVSGGHLALIAAGLVYALDRLGATAFSRTIVLAFVMGCYVVYTGGAPSAVRSLVMVAAGMASVLCGRRQHGPSSLSIAVAVIVLADPGVVFDLGFKLSVMSVLFILTFAGYVSALFASLGAPRFLAQGLSMTLAAQWATLPITIPTFSELSLIAPVANIVLAPIMSALLAIGMVATIVSVAVPSLPAMLVPDALARAALFAVDVLAHVPSSSIVVDGVSSSLALVAGMYLPALAVYALWRLPSRRAVLSCSLAGLAACSLYVVHWSCLAPPSITVLDVGQGDAILIRDGPDTALIDCGVDETTARALARNHVFSLDLIAITHWDLDHWGGLGDICSSYPVGEVAVPVGGALQMPDDYRATGAPDPLEVRVGDAFAVGDFRCEVIWPGPGADTSENEGSMVLKVSYTGGEGELSVLLTGDTEAGEVASYAPAAGKVDVLKLGHHGSAASVSEDMLRELDPVACIASAGAGNPYGHPAPETVAAVESSGSVFACTIDSGDIELRPGADSVWMATGR